MLRFAQQIIVPEIGAEGQNKIAAAKVLVVGAGGLGTPVACYLAAGGIGNIGIIDGDKVETTNLHRQFLYNSEDIGQNKAEVLANRLKQQNPALSISVTSCFLDIEMAKVLFADYDVICDCTDNFVARVVIDKVCGIFKKPLVYAAVKEWEGYVTVLHYKKGVALFNVFPEQIFGDGSTSNCSISGIVNATCGIAGSIQAAEVFKIVTEAEGVLDGSLLCFNALVHKYRTLNINLATTW